jgi:acyl carrier protein
MSLETTKALKEFIFGRFPQAKKKNIGDTDELLNSGIVDSLGILEIVGFIEKTFGVTVADDELTSENFETLTALTNFVELKRHSSAASQA